VAAYVWALWGQSGAPDALSGAQDAPRRPKGVQKGPQRVTLRSPKRHFWEPHWREWPLAKTPAGAMFSSHYEGPGPSLFARKITSGTRCALETFFFPLLCPLWTAKWGPRSAKWGPRSLQGSPKGPKGAPKPPPGHLKITKKLTRGPIWKKGRPGRLQGCPREGK
jgi:hypothetical protein